MRNQPRRARLECATQEDRLLGTSLQRIRQDSRGHRLQHDGRGGFAEKECNSCRLYNTFRFDPRSGWDLKITAKKIGSDNRNLCKPYGVMASNQTYSSVTCDDARVNMDVNGREEMIRQLRTDRDYVIKWVQRCLAWGAEVIDVRGDGASYHSGVIVHRCRKRATGCCVSNYKITVTQACDNPAFEKFACDATIPLAGVRSSNSSMVVLCGVVMAAKGEKEYPSC